MERDDLITQRHRAERALLLDLLAGRQASFTAIDVSVFLEITPETLHPYLHVATANTTGVPEALRAAFAAAYRREMLVHLRRLATLKQVDAAFAAAGIEYLVLKGPILAATAYPNAAARTMTDLDFLVPHGRGRDAEVALSGVGFEPAAHYAGEEMTPGDRAPLASKSGAPFSVEVHELLDSMPNDVAGVASAFTRRRLVALGNGVTVPALDREEFFAQVVLHASRHHRFEGELRSLLDVALLLKSPEAAFDWERAAETWRQRGIFEWIALTVELAAVLLDAPRPRVFEVAAPDDDMMRIAAEQLWSRKKMRVPPRVLQAVTGRTMSPVHDLPAEIAPTPPGWRGVRARLDGHRRRVMRIVDALRRGALRPANVREHAALFNGREQLFRTLEERAKTKPE